MNNTLQHELYENARNRIKQKRKLFVHFVLFFVGSIFLIVLDKLLDVYATHPGWSLYVILAWAFLFILHFVNVFITKRFMNKQWEREEIDKLVAKQQRKITELQKKVESDFGKTLTSEESETE